MHLFLPAVKKTPLPGTEITAKTIAGKWTVSSITYQTYKDGKLYREDPLEAYAYDFEFKGDGTVGYTEGDVTSTGQYTIKYDAAKGKYVYWVGIQGRNGYPDEGTAEIKMINKDSFALRFETASVTGPISVVLENMVRK
ncbi:hypothetical protein GWR56_07595 [Mucilaginibacter sp. 14171R-50]|uniref:hypothetical protein n=1 Tax=Mucilaginibacter sp. 14171R-50 TaxID=2703789 RepID=UPI00138CBE84|nr:hypothetical protein [Mucilaginibacter sp. 14171R-50]QHS55409.1 hypothetical protein GWR56_07595 [Mucilaginibacter sp. 14171R-50]